MGSFSIGHGLVYLVVIAGLVIPSWLIFKRAGWSPWWALTLVIPFAAIVLLWVFALARWPSLDRANQPG